MTQLGTAFRLSISTIVFNSVLNQQARRLGVASSDPAPQIHAYRAAEWTAFGFGMLGM